MREREREYSHFRNVSAVLIMLRLAKMTLRPIVSGFRSTRPFSCKDSSSVSANPRDRPSRSGFIQFSSFLKKQQLNGDDYLTTWIIFDESYGFVVVLRRVGALIHSSSNKLIHPIGFDFLRG